MTINLIQNHKQNNVIQNKIQLNNKNIVVRAVTIRNIMVKDLVKIWMTAQLR